MGKFYMSPSSLSTDMLICTDVLEHALAGKALGKFNGETGTIEFDNDKALTPDDLRDLAAFIEEYLYWRN